MRARLGTTAAAAMMLMVAGCGSASPRRTAASASASTASATSRSPSATPVATASGTPTPSADERAAHVLAGMSESDRVGQLLMVGSASTQADAATLAALIGRHVGSVILDGTSHLSGEQTKAVVSELQANAGPVPLLIATDQEGGEVQRLVGPGFTQIPSALQQGAIDPATLTAQAATWAEQLKTAGVSMNLGPVLDTVPSATFAPQNAPIGNFDREFGYDPATVSSHGLAVLDGFERAGVATTVKHFPGLGRVTSDTDNAANVTDAITTATDAYLAPFRDAVKAGVPFVMMSSAIYSQIDSARPAAFSAIVIGLLRNNLGFSGVVISDDLANTRQVASVPAAQRGIDFVAAGGDMVLSVDVGAGVAMDEAILAKADAEPAFKAQVDAAALRVLQAKARYGLLN